MMLLNWAMGESFLLKTLIDEYYYFYTAKSESGIEKQSKLLLVNVTLATYDGYFSNPPFCPLATI